MGTNAFSPQRAESFRHFLLLPSTSLAYHRRKPTNLRVSLGTSAAQLQASRLRVRSHAGAYSLAAQRTGKGYAGRCAEVVEVSRRLIGDAEHFWQKRYYDFNIRNYPQFVEKLRYIHRNPVKAGLCERPEQWEWSSFRHYATGCEGRVEIESEWTARGTRTSGGKTLSSDRTPSTRVS